MSRFNLPLTNIFRRIVPTQTGWDGVTGFGYQAKTAGTVFTDETANCNSVAANDVPFFDNATWQVDDAFYWGDSTIPFNQIKINVGTAGVYNATLVWEYYNGATWATLTTTDGTVGLTVSGTNYVTFTAPSDWAKDVVNAQNAYWVRLRTSVFTATTTTPVGTQCWMGAAPTSLSNATDGDVSTTTGTASVNMSGSGTFGAFVVDLGSIKTVLVGGRFGLWSTASTINGYVISSDDNITYRTQVDSLITVGSTSEKIVEMESCIFTGRYIKFYFTIGGAAVTCNMKCYEIFGFQLSYV